MVTAVSHNVTFPEISLQLPSPSPSPPALSNLYNVTFSSYYCLLPSITSSHISFPFSFSLSVLSLRFLSLLPFLLAFSLNILLYIPHPPLSVPQTAPPVHFHQQSHWCLFFSGGQFWLADICHSLFNRKCTNFLLFVRIAQIITEMTSLPLCVPVI